jgi:feruloyl esterase
MKSFAHLLLLVVLLNHASIAQDKQVKSCKPCASFTQLALPEVRISKAESQLRDTINANPFEPPVIVSVPFCRLEGIIGNEIGFELYLPANWNGRFLMSGNGGFAGAFQNSLVNYVNEGYAIASTNTGHTGSGIQADWALNNMERQLNFGHLAVHRTTAVAKSLITTAYCQPPSFNYFLGCSRGGGQALMEAQRYPDDYDGIVCGAPAFDWPAIGAKGISIAQKNYPDPKNPNKPILTNESLKLLQEIVCKQCDLADGLGDCILNEPNNCRIDFNQLPRCPGDTASASCFTGAQIETLKKIFEPLMVDNKLVYPAYPPGIEAAEGGIDLWIAGTSAMLKPSLHHFFANGIFKFLIMNDPRWDFRSYDFKNFDKETRYAASYLNATQANYVAFEKSRGKMILYHGWNDPALSAYATIQHYEEAMKQHPNLPSFMRLFLLPGVLHCNGGPGADNVDYVRLIRNWVEKDQAPERVIFEKKDKGKTVMTRPVYPYPKVAVYDGKGDPNKESSFVQKK